MCTSPHATANRGPYTPSTFARPTTTGSERSASATVRSSFVVQRAAPGEYQSDRRTVESLERPGDVGRDGLPFDRQSQAPPFLGRKPARERHQPRSTPGAQPADRVGGSRGVQKDPPTIFLVCHMRALDADGRCPLHRLRQRPRDPEHACDSHGDRLPGAIPGVVRTPHAAASGSPATVRAGLPVSSASVEAASDTSSAASRATTVPCASTIPRRSHTPLSIAERSVKKASCTANPAAAVGTLRNRMRCTHPGAASRSTECVCAGE
jgi:hypothetical protein